MRKVLLIFSLVLLSGCATTSYRANKCFETYFDTPKTVAVVPPDVKIHKLTAGGVIELVDEWSDDAKNDLLAAVKSELADFPKIKLIVIDEKALSEGQREYLREQEALYKAVSVSIINHTYVPISTFPHKLQDFDYTLGPEISAVSSIVAADSLLFCSGTNYIWTTGRVCMATFGLLLGAASGVCVLPTAGPEMLSMSLVDTVTGNIIWFDYVPMQGDLRNADLDAKLAKKFFSHFPKK